MQVKFSPLKLCGCLAWQAMLLLFDESTRWSSVSYNYLLFAELHSTTISSPLISMKVFRVHEYFIRAIS